MRACVQCRWAVLYLGHNRKAVVIAELQSDLETEKTMLQQNDSADWMLGAARQQAEAAVLSSQLLNLPRYRVPSRTLSCFQGSTHYMWPGLSLQGVL